MFSFAGTKAASRLIIPRLSASTSVNESGTSPSAFTIAIESFSKK